MEGPGFLVGVYTIKEFPRKYSKENQKEYP